MTAGEQTVLLTHAPQHLERERTRGKLAVERLLLVGHEAVGKTARHHAGGTLIIDHRANAYDVTSVIYVLFFRKIQSSWLKMLESWYIFRMMAQAFSLDSFLTISSLFTSEFTGTCRESIVIWKTWDAVGILVR